MRAANFGESIESKLLQYRTCERGMARIVSLEHLAGAAVVGAPPPPLVFGSIFVFCGLPDRAGGKILIPEILVSKSLDGRVCGGWSGLRS
jgi:hypothetical protein